MHRPDQPDDPLALTQQQDIPRPRRRGIRQRPVEQVETYRGLDLGSDLLAMDCVVKITKAVGNRTMERIKAMMAA
jgi:hypothetical protein